MIPGIDPRQLKQMMKQMGMTQDDVNATKVIIETPEKKLIFESPEVQKVKMQGQETFQILGSYTEEENEVKLEISQSDIEMVAEQGGVSPEKAKEELEKTNGDIAEAISNLS